MHVPSSKIFWVALAVVTLPAMAVCAGLGRAPAPPPPEVRPVAHERAVSPASLVISPVSSSLPPISPSRNRPMALAVEVIESGKGGTWKQVEVQVTAVPEPSLPVLLLPGVLLFLRRRRSAR